VDIEEQEWLSSYELRQLVGRYRPDVDFLEERLSLPIALGDVRVRARRAIISGFGGRPEGTPERNFDVPAEWFINKDGAAKASFNLRKDGLWAREGRPDRRDRKEAECDGLLFSKNGILKVLEINASELLKQPAPHDSVSWRPVVEKGVGAKARAEHWRQFAAAMAHLLERGDLKDLNNTSKTHTQIADFLASKGHTDVLSVVTVKSAIRRLAAWQNDRPFVDDHDYDNSK